MTKTNPHFWDCNCPTEYIHTKADPICGECGANYHKAPHDYPDSHEDEISVVSNHANSRLFPGQAILHTFDVMKKTRELTEKFGANVLFLEELQTDDQKEVKRLSELLVFRDNEITDLQDRLDYRNIRIAELKEEIIEQKREAQEELQERTSLLTSLAMRHEQDKNNADICQCIWHKTQRKLS